jgi:hypothetical protein
MAAVIKGVGAPGVSQSPDLAQGSVELGHDIERMQAEMARGIQLGGLKNDPTLALIKALSTSLGLQWRLHDQAVRYFRSASERLDSRLAETIAQGEQALATRRIAIVECLAPELAKLTTKHARTWRRSVTLKTAVTFGGIAVALALGVGLAGLWGRLAGWTYLRPRCGGCVGRCDPPGRAGC